MVVWSLKVFWLSLLAVHFVICLGRVGHFLSILLAYTCSLDVRKNRRFAWQERGESRERLREGTALLRYKTCGQNTWTYCISLLILITRLSTATIKVSLWSGIHILFELCSLSCLETQTREFLMMVLTQQSHLSPASPFKCNSTFVRQNPYCIQSISCKVHTVGMVSYLVWKWLISKHKWLEWCPPHNCKPSSLDRGMQKDFQTTRQTWRWGKAKGGSDWHLGTSSP